MLGPNTCIPLNFLFNYFLLIPLLLTTYKFRLPLILCFLFLIHILSSISLFYFFTYKLKSIPDKYNTKFL